MRALPLTGILALVIGLYTPVWAGMPAPLTPPAPPQPRLTGPQVFGVRPGSPFIHNITATGARPMKFAARNLPAGLTLNADTGWIRGTLTRAGGFDVTVSASNAKGTATRNLRIVAGPDLCLTPPLGWSSWNVYGKFVDDAKVRAAAEHMASSGLADHGYAYINVDDGWSGPRAPAPNGPLTGDAAKFPDMRALADYVQDRKSVV
jgi:alpha-galactosidase